MRLRRMRLRRMAFMLVFTGLIVAALAAPAFAWTNDTTAQGTDSCSSAKSATATIVWTFSVHTPFGYHGRTLVTSSNDPAIPVGTSLTNGGTISETRATSALPFTLSLKVNYPDPGGDMNQYSVPATQGGSLTVQPPGNCSPVSHSPTLAGTGTCNAAASQFTVTFTGTTDGGTATPSLPKTDTLPGTATSDSLTVTFSYADGPDITKTYTVQLTGDCAPAAVLDPKATITRPTCVSRFFRVTLNNSGSNQTVAFWIIHPGWATTEVDVASGATVVKIVTAHSNERIWVRALHRQIAGKITSRSFSTCGTPPPTTKVVSQ